MDVKIHLEERHSELVKIIQAFENLEKSDEWATLKELVFDKALKSIDSQILQESIMTEIKTNKLYYLQGQRMWAMKYCNINKFIEGFIKELEEVNKIIK